MAAQLIQSAIPRLPNPEADLFDVIGVTISLSAGIERPSAVGGHVGGMRASERNRSRLPRTIGLQARVAANLAR